MIGVEFDESSGMYTISRYSNKLKRMVMETDFETKRRAKMRSDHLYLIHNQKNVDFDELNYPSKLSNGQRETYYGVTDPRGVDKSGFVAKRTVLGEVRLSERLQWAYQAAVISDHFAYTLSNGKPNYRLKLNFPDDKPGKPVDSERDLGDATISELIKTESPVLEGSNKKSRKSDAKIGIGVSFSKGRYRVRRREASTGLLRGNEAFRSKHKAFMASDMLYLKFAKNPRRAKLNFPENMPDDWKELEHCPMECYGVKYKSKDDKFHVKRKVKGESKLTHA